MGPMVEMHAEAYSLHIGNLVQYLSEAFRHTQNAIGLPYIGLPWEAGSRDKEVLGRVW